MVIVVEEVCKEFVGFGNYGFQKQIQGKKNEYHLFVK